MIKTYLVRGTLNSSPLKNNIYRSFEELMSGDTVVVTMNGELGIATVDSQCQTTVSDNSIKGFVVCKIDTEAVKEKIEKYKKQRALEQALESRYMQASRMSIYKQLAESDLTMKQLLDDLENIK